MDSIYFFLFLNFILLLFWAYFKVKYQYWKGHGVAYREPRFPFGNLEGIQPTKQHSEFFKTLYDEFKHSGRFCGIFFFIEPACIVTDLDLVKSILVKDFTSFHDRNVYYNLKDDPLTGHLVNLEGEKWKKLREKLIPTFTSGKMRFMLPTILRVAEEFKMYLENSVLSQNEFEIKEVLARFTVNIIGSCAFGIDCNTFKDPNSEFLKMGMKSFENPRNGPFKQRFTRTFPNLARKMGMKHFRDDVSKFFMKTVADVIEYREKNTIKSNDFMDLLIGMKSEGRMEFNELAAQAFVFFLAGFETSSTTMTFVLYELSLNQDIQEKCRANIKQVLERHQGEMTYEALSEMNYLEQCINESLRKYPPFGTLSRNVTKDYLVPDTNIVLPKGMPVIIPVYGIHHDPDIYEDPEKFDPDRFLPENTAKRHSMAFLAFGQGNRICIGERFGYLEAKVGLATLLSTFKFETSSRTKNPIQFAPRKVVLTTVGGMFLKVTKL